MKPSTASPMEMPKPRPVIIAYVPVLHAGYKRLFDKDPTAKIYVLGPELIGEFDQLRKELRALKPADAVTALKGWGRSAQVLDIAMLKQLANAGADVIMPDEDICHELAEKYLSGAKISYETIFLRWDRRRMEANSDPLDPDRTISEDEFDREMLAKAVEQSAKSTNIWRRVGAVVVKDGAAILSASNRHEPLPHANWVDGDPRGNANRGVAIATSTDMHAEARVIAEAAKRGLSLEGVKLYVTTFPCSVCAKLVANSGVAQCYYAQGYTDLDGQEVLKAHGVELIHVTGVSTDDPNPDVWVTYPEKKK